MNNRLFYFVTYGSFIIETCHLLLFAINGSSLVSLLNYFSMAINITILKLFSSYLNIGFKNKNIDNFIKFYLFHPQGIYLVINKNSIMYGL